jgi:hypothetical protein
VTLEDAQKLLGLSVRGRPVIGQCRPDGWRGRVEAFLGRGLLEAGRLICFYIVEQRLPHRVAHQFGLRQEWPVRAVLNIRGVAQVSVKCLIHLLSPLMLPS